MGQNGPDTSQQQAIKLPFRTIFKLGIRTYLASFFHLLTTYFLYHFASPHAPLGEKNREIPRDFRA